MDFWAEGQGFDSPWLLSFFFFFFSSFFLASQGKFSKALHHAEVSYTHFGHMYPEQLLKANTNIVKDILLEDI
jgi:hypothetical protein